MQRKKVVVKNEHGLHARVALNVLEKATMLDSRITVCKGCEKANGCSILELLMLGAKQGTELEIIAEGGDEEKSVEQIVGVFGEGI